MFVLKNDFFYGGDFLTELDFLKGDTNIYFKYQITRAESQKNTYILFTFSFVAKRN